MFSCLKCVLKALGVVFNQMRKFYALLKMMARLNISKVAS